MINLSLTPDQFRVLFEMIILCIASTERSPAREEMKEVLQIIQAQVPEPCGDQAIVGKTIISVS
jgi:hypothetical protein